MYKIIVSCKGMYSQCHVFYRNADTTYSASLKREFRKVYPRPWSIKVELVK